MHTSRHRISAALLAPLAICAAFAAGCENEKESRPWYGSRPSSGAAAPTNGGESAAPSSTESELDATLFGTWSLSNGGETWYVHFFKDGTWKITDDRAGTAERVHGSYTTNAAAFSGNMVNPGVGTGEINGFHNGNAIRLNFVEYWHTPHKTVVYTGSRQ